MRCTLPALALLGFAAGTAPAWTGSGTLTLVAPGTTSNNKLTIAISAVSGGNTARDTQTTTVSGTLITRIDADPATGKATALTLDRGGNLSMTNMNFNLRYYLLNIIPVSVATFSTSGMGGYAYTPAPPAPVTPASGSFDASLHNLVINRGTLTGSVTITNPPTPIHADFSATPTEGSGIGNGTLTLVPGSSSATHRDCAVTLLLPVDFTDTQTDPGSGVVMTIHVTGTVKATGTIPIPLNGWIDWTLQNGLAGAAFDGGAPLGLAWAAGLAADTPATALTPRVGVTPTGPLATLPLAGTGTRGAIWVEISPSLADGSWTPAPAARLSNGANPIPPGTAGPVTVDLGGGPEAFVRMRADQP